MFGTGDPILACEFQQKFINSIDGNGSRAEVVFVSCNYPVHAASDCCSDHNGILIVVVLNGDGILTIYAKRVEQIEQRQEFRYYCTAFGFYIFLFIELFY